MINFFLANWDSILIVLAVIAVAILLIYKGKRGVVDKMIYKIVTEMEQEYGAGTGNLKLAAAVELLYPKLPAIIRMFTTSAGIVKMIENGLAEAKKKWETNVALGKYIENNKNIIVNCIEKSKE